LWQNVEKEETDPAALQSDWWRLQQPPPLPRDQNDCLNSTVQYKMYSSVKLLPIATALQYSHATKHWHAISCMNSNNQTFYTQMQINQRSKVLSEKRCLT
jgi:hypothetical protein